MRNVILLLISALSLVGASPAALPQFATQPLMATAAARESNVDSQWYLPKSTGRASLPLQGKVVGEFHPPEKRWMAGHRGIDIAGNVGSPIYAAASGVVAYAGVINDRPVISLDHGNLRTTYEPVEAVVTQGEKVSAGQMIGILMSGHCPQVACLHWGAKKPEDVYLDPRLLLHGHSVLIGPNPALEHARRK